MLCFQSMFHELIKFVHIHVNKELRGEISKWQSFARSSLKTENNIFQQGHDILVRNILVKNMNQSSLVNAGKELSNIALQNLSRPTVVPTDFTAHAVKSCQCFMSALIHTAGIRIGDKRSVEKRIKLMIHGVMKQAISNAGFVNMSWLWISNVKTLVSAVTVRPVGKFLI